MVGPKKQEARRVRLSVELRRALALAGPLLRPADAASVGLLFAVFAVGAAASAVELRCSHLRGRLMQTLADRSWDGFRRVLGDTMICGLVDSMLWVAFQYLQERLVLEWRSRLSKELVSRYTSGLRFYHLALGEGVESEPNRGLGSIDQRVTDDTADFCYLSVRFSFKLMRYLVRAVGFTGVLWGISRRLALLCILYSALSTVALQRAFGERLVGLNDVRISLQARVRFLLVRLREHAEGVALHLGGPAERRALHSAVSGAAAAAGTVLRWEAAASAARGLSAWGPQWLPLAVLAPDYFAREVNLGELTQATHAFAQTQETLSIVVNYFDELARYRTVLARLHSLACALEAAPRRTITAARTAAGAPALPSLPAGAQLSTPAGLCVARLTKKLRLCEGARIIVEGPSGTGKSTLLRSLRGVWPHGTLPTARGGHGEDPTDGTVCLSQQPYLLPAGASLAQQVCYPQGLQEAGAVRAAIARAGLEQVAARSGGPDAPADLASTLSGGERQRVGSEGRWWWRRRRRRLLLMDEPIAPCDAAMAEKLFGELHALQQRVQHRCCVVTVSHSPLLRRWHDRVLSIQPSGVGPSIVTYGRIQ
eukprot:TRINITY_DN36719_c1_g4_i1.p1 TRINITY_DN36719_c1_g4~~TRINITY_DN36719_c1_g4_i1.p1  ORF type:complete len:621 (+),score=194.14 TRINITY_DN36719_c1_g4_i1:77-1864(+)